MVSGRRDLRYSFEIRISERRGRYANPALSRLLCLGLLIWIPLQLTAEEIPWKRSVYTRLSEEEPLTALLYDFCADQGITAVLSPAVQGVVSGRFEEMAPEIFFDQLVHTYNLMWYFHAGALYIYQGHEIQSQLLVLGHVTPSRLTLVLDQVGILDPRYPLRSVNPGNLVYITGPPRFVELVTETAHALDLHAENRARQEAERFVIRVFPLRHAWADDVTFHSMDQELTVPGVASVLRRLLGTQNASDAASTTRTSARTVQKLKGQGLASVGEEPGSENPATPQSPEAASGLSADTALVQADVRLNAVVIRDRQENMDFYQQVIDDLDRPAGLVEIQATIIDINSDYSREVGFSWRREKENDTSAGIGTDDGFLFGNQPFESSDGLTYTTIIGDPTDYFLARLRALEKDGQAHVLSQPMVLTLNNVEAHLESTDTFYVRVAGDYEVDLFNVSTGVVLKVTPHIIEDPGDTPRIKLSIKIEDGNIMDSAVDEIPIIRRNTINTQAVVNLDESLLIGGYSVETSSHTTRKVPGLGNVPLFKVLFRHREKRNLKVERLFLITPRIVDQDEAEGERDIPLVPTFKEDLGSSPLPIPSAPDPKPAASKFSSEEPKTANPSEEHPE